MFGWGYDICDGARYNLQWKATNLHCVLSVYGKPTTHVGILRHTVKVRRRSIVVAGIGGVVTTPIHRGRGYAVLAMKEVHRFLVKKMRIDFGLLFCPNRLKSFYVRLGWRFIHTTVFIDQPVGSVGLPLNAMVLQCGSKRWPKGTIFLQSRPW